MENKYVVGAAPTGDAPTTAEWWTIQLPTKGPLILDTWRYICVLERVLLKLWWVIFHCGYFPYYKIISILSNHIHIWQGSSHFSCTETCHIWIYIQQFNIVLSFSKNETIYLGKEIWLNGWARSQPMREDITYVCNVFSQWLRPSSAIDRNAPRSEWLQNSWWHHQQKLTFSYKNSFTDIDDI